MSGKPGRRQRPVPEPDSPLGQLALALRKLRDDAGQPSYEDLAHETTRLGYRFSGTSLRNAASGKIQPTAEVTEMFVRACVAFARAQPARATDAARSWVPRDLVTSFLRRWRATQRPMRDTARLPGPAALPTGTAGAPPPEAEPDPPATRTPPTPAGELPAEATTFFGRETELGTIQRLLRTVRLVTLVGTGGVGKTRCALRAAAAASRHYPDGMYLADLAALTDPRLLPRTVATALDLHEQLTAGTAEEVAEHLAGARALLLLDNCEHLLESCAAFVATLLAVAPHITVLATSRQSLATGGEHLVRLDPLPVPHLAATGEPTAAADTAERTAGPVTDCPSVRLFADRAAALLPGFTVHQHNVRQVAQVCQQLDGLPLAIELAVRWLRVLSLPELLERLSNRYTLLSDGLRTGPVRHRTLRAVFDWSYTLCTADEQRLWRRFAVFAGPVDLTTVAAVCAADDLPSGELLPILAGLVDKSVVETVPSAGATRYTMLASVRAYGWDRLADAGERHRMRLRHHDWYRRLAIAAEEHWHGPEQLRWLDRLRTEHADLRRALENGLSRLAVERSGSTARTVATLWLYWMALGHPDEGRYWAERVWEARDGAPAEQAETMWIAGNAALLQGDHAAADRLISQGRRLARQSPAHTTARLEMVAGLLAVFRGDTATAETLSRSALIGCRDAGDNQGARQSLAQLALTELVSGRPHAADRTFRQVLEMGGNSGGGWLRSHMLWLHGIAYWQTGQVRAALRAVDEAIAVKTPLEDHCGIGSAIDVLAWISVSEGDARLAADLLGAASAVWRNAGQRLLGFRFLLDQHAACVSAAARTLGDEQFTARVAAGAARDAPSAIRAARAAVSRLGGRGTQRDGAQRDDTPGEGAPRDGTPGEGTPRHGRSGTEGPVAAAAEGPAAR